MSSTPTLPPSALPPAGGAAPAAAIALAEAVSRGMAASAAATSRSITRPPGPEPSSADASTRLGAARRSRAARCPSCARAGPRRLRRCRSRAGSPGWPAPQRAAASAAARRRGGTGRRCRRGGLPVLARRADHRDGLQHRDIVALGPEYLQQDAALARRDVEAGLVGLDFADDSGRRRPCRPPRPSSAR